MKKGLVLVFALCLTSIINAQERTENWRDSIASLIVNYLGSETWEDAINYVMEPERVRPLMQKYYEGNGFVSYERSVEEIKHDFGISKIDGISHAIYKCDKYWVVKTVEGYKIDWEASVQYNPVTLNSIRKFPNRVFEIRTYTYIGSRDNGNWRDYYCNYLSHTYVKKNSPVDKKLFEYLTGGGRNMTLKIKYVTSEAPDYDKTNPVNNRDTDRNPYVIITDVVSKNFSRY